MNHSHEAGSSGSVRNGFPGKSAEETRFRSPPPLAPLPPQFLLSSLVSIDAPSLFDPLKWSRLLSSLSTEGLPPVSADIQDLR